jgi:hypothetical protein
VYLTKTAPTALSASLTYLYYNNQRLFTIVLERAAIATCFKGEKRAVRAKAITFSKQGLDILKEKNY